MLIIISIFILKQVTRVQVTSSDITNITAATTPASIPDSYNDTLLRHMTPYVTTQISSHNAVRKIAEHSSRREEFLQRYSSLKIKQPRELDSLVYLLLKLADDPRLCEFIRQRRPPPSVRVPVQVMDLDQLDIPSLQATGITCNLI